MLTEAGRQAPAQALYFIGNQVFDLDFLGMRNA
jgi:hypothetical protein